MDPFVSFLEEIRLVFNEPHHLVDAFSRTNILSHLLALGTRSIVKPCNSGSKCISIFVNWCDTISSCCDHYANNCLCTMLTTGYCSLHCICRSSPIRISELFMCLDLFWFLRVFFVSLTDLTTLLINNY